MNGNKLIEMKPVGYVGIILFLGGLLVPNMLNIRDTVIQTFGVIVAIFGFYLFMYKGRIKHDI
jgi:membrane-bound ClpP family serine protease